VNKYKRIIYADQLQLIRNDIDTDGDE